MLALQELYGLGYDHHLKYASFIEKITPDDLIDVARRYLDLERFVVTAVKPNGAPSVKKLVRELGD